MSTKEKKRCDEPFVPSSRRRKVRKSSLERDRRCARKRKRGGVGEKSAPKRPGHNVLLLPAVSLWNDRIQNALSSASSSSRKHSSRLRDVVVVAARAVLSVYYRATFITGRFSFSRREKHTTHRERAVLKMQFQNKVVLSLSCVGRRTFRIRLRPEIGEGVSSSSSSSSSRALAAAVYKSVVSSQRRHL